MPRNRRPRDAAEKRSEIVDAAAELFTGEGYDSTPMAKVANAAGVTSNTIYWYFADKDALLIAVLDQVLDRALTEAASRTEAPWADQVHWAVDQLERYARLVAVVHTRAAVAPAIDLWHRNFHSLVDQMLARGFRQAGVPEADLDAMVKIGVFVVEGLLMHPHAAPEREAVLELLTRSKDNAP